MLSESWLLKKVKKKKFFSKIFFLKLRGLGIHRSFDPPGTARFRQGPDGLRDSVPSGDSDLRLSNWTYCCDGRCRYGRHRLGSGARSSSLSGSTCTATRRPSLVWRHLRVIRSSCLDRGIGRPSSGICLGWLSSANWRDTMCLLRPSTLTTWRATSQLVPALGFTFGPSTVILWPASTRWWVKLVTLSTFSACVSRSLINGIQWMWS